VLGGGNKKRGKVGVVCQMGGGGVGGEGGGEDELGGGVWGGAREVCVGCAGAEGWVVWGAEKRGAGRSEDLL